MTSDEGTVLPPGAELRLRISAERLTRIVAAMSVASKDRPTALGPQMLRLRTDGELLRASVDTGEMRLTMVVEDVEVLDEGAVSVVLAEFAAKTKALNSKTVEVSVLDAEKILLRTARTLWQVSGVVGAWEEHDEGDEQVVATWPAKGLADAVKGVIGAVPKGGGRPVLERIHLQGEWATATSGSILMKRRLPGELSTSIDIPRSAAGIVGSRTGGTVALAVGQKSAVLKYQHIEIVLPKPMLAYPDTSKAEMAAHVEATDVLIIDAEEFLGALKRVRAYSDPNSPEVAIRTVQGAKGWVAFLTSEDRSGNAAREALGGSWQAEKRLNAVFHHAHLASLFRGLSGEVDLHIAVEGKTAFIDDDTRGLFATIQRMVA